MFLPIKVWLETVKTRWFNKNKLTEVLAFLLVFLIRKHLLNDPTGTAPDVIQQANSVY